MITVQEYAEALKNIKLYAMNSSFWSRLAIPFPWKIFWREK